MQNIRVIPNCLPSDVEINALLNCRENPEDGGRVRRVQASQELEQIILSGAISIARGTGKTVGGCAGRIDIRKILRTPRIGNTVTDGIQCREIGHQIPIRIRDECVTGRTAGHCAVGGPVHETEKGIRYRAHGHVGATGHRPAAAGGTTTDWRTGGSDRVVVERCEVRYQTVILIRCDRVAGRGADHVAV